MARDDCAHYYDETVGAIESMATFLKADRLVLLNKEQCKQMILAFIQVRTLLAERKNLKTNSTCTLVLRELYRQTIAAVAVLESCCCYRVHKFPQKTKPSDSWLEVAVTQSRMVFRVILDDLNWCSRLVARVGDPSQTTEEEPNRRYRYNSLLTDMDQEAIEADTIAFRERLDNLGSVPQRDRLLANFLRERLRAPLDSNDSEDANDCLWKRTLSDRILDDCVLETRWLGVRVVRKVSKLYYKREKQIMKSLDHPNIVRFITCSKEDDAIFMEPVKTTLEKHLKLHPNLSLLKKVDIMFQIASVMAYLHGNGVAHCDIKPANMLVNPCEVAGLEGYVHLKLADFGHSVSGLKEEMLRNSSMKNRGTTRYRAPEMYGTPMNVNFKKADVFPYALTCWHILHCKDPFTDMTRDEREKAILKGRDILPFDPDVPLPLQKLIERCWSKDPEDRPTFSEISIVLEAFKEELLLGVNVPFDQSISGLENTARRKWKVLQSIYDAAKALAVQIRPPHVRAWFAKQEEEYVYPGPDHEDPQIAPATTDVEGRAPEQSIPASSRCMSWKSRVSRWFSRPEEDYVYSGSD